MALRLKGSRRIVVDGMAYRWRVRHRATYEQQIFGGTQTFAVQQADGHGQLLWASTMRPHAADVGAASGGDTLVPVTPAEVAATVRAAIAAGWRPAEPGAPFTYPTGALE